MQTTQGLELFSSCNFLFQRGLRDTLHTGRRSLNLHFVFLILFQTSSPASRCKSSKKPPPCTDVFHTKASTPSLCGRLRSSCRTQPFMARRMNNCFIALKESRPASCFSTRPKQSAVSGTAWIEAWTASVSTRLRSCLRSACFTSEQWIEIFEVAPGRPLTVVMDDHKTCNLTGKG